MAFEDKRSSRRFDVELPVRVVRGETQLEGVTQNLSLGGMLVHAAFDPPATLGERVQLAFRVPQLPGAIEVEAEVRWMKDAVVGVQFVTGLRAKHTWALGKFLDSLAAS